MTQQTLVRGLGDVMAFGHFRPDPGLGQQLLLRQKQVDQWRQGYPDPVQQRNLTGGVVAPVADGAAGDVPVLLLDMAAVVLVRRPRPGEGDLLVDTPPQQVGVDELAAVEFLTDVKLRWWS
jgi:hypothetical protein